MNLMKNIPLCCCMLIGMYTGIYTGVVTADEPLAAAIRESVAGDEAARLSQAQIDKLDDQTRDLAQEYRSTLEQTDSLGIYNGQLEKLINNQKEELSSIDDQMRDVEETQRNIEIGRASCRERV